MTASTITARRIGREAQPIVIVDGFHPDAHALRAAAIGAPFQPALHHYPGVRAELPANYFAQVRPALMTVLREVFRVRSRIDLIDASFSIVTTPPEALTLPQRLPHVDAIEFGRIALVHYLAPDDRGGTAFYRHRDTGFETVDAVRSQDYRERLDRALRDGGEPAQAYIDGSTPLFEEIGRVDAAYNRAVIYRSALLHSGAIPAGAALSEDPAAGRLTVTAFLDVA